MNEIPETRASLVLRLQDPSDQQAWEEFVQLYQPVVYRVGLSRGLQEADASDLVQTVFVSIAGAIGRWNPRDSKVRFRHWLLRVAKNATINALTRRPADQAGAFVDELLEEVEARNQQSESLIELEYRRELFIRATEMVRVDFTADTWKAFELTAIQGLSKEDAARELGKSIGTVYAARSRIIRRLTEVVAMLEGQFE
ncbi:MAG: sigma-70 family RNA polymerase sigma factor [Planctomycetota bacterium]